MKIHRRSLESHELRKTSAGADDGAAVVGDEMFFRAMSGCRPAS